MSDKGYREYGVAPEWCDDPLVVRVHDDRSVEVNGERFIMQRRDGHVRLVDVIHGDRSIPAVVRLDTKGSIVVSMQGYMYQVSITDRSYEQWYAIVRAGSQQTTHRIVVKAPMPGLLKSGSVEPGQNVRKGQTLFVLEAMKMENAIKAPVSGFIISTGTAEGSAVEKGAVLCIIDTTAG
ncbi:MAG: biotin/lipoyl-containing protein [Candidatus Kapaibacterium sp.]